MKGNTNAHYTPSNLPTADSVFAKFSSASSYSKVVVTEGGVRYARLIFTSTSTFAVSSPVALSHAIAIGAGGSGGGTTAPGGQSICYGTGGKAGNQITALKGHNLVSGNYTVSDKYTADLGSATRLELGSSVLINAERGVSGEDLIDEAVSSSSRNGEDGYTVNVTGVMAGAGVLSLDPAAEAAGLVPDGEPGSGGYGYGAGGGGSISCGYWEARGGSGAPGAIILFVEVQ